MSCPTISDENTTPAINGMSCRPEVVADSPFTTCWYCGRYVVAPYSAAPTARAITHDTTKTELRNRCSGTSGSGTPRSTRTNAASNPTAPTTRPRITGDPQSYSLPPQLV